MPRPRSTPCKDPVPIVQEAGWALGPVWSGVENNNNNNILLTANGLSPGGSGHLTHIQNMRQVCY
jgi:hypothetical protein